MELRMHLAWLILLLSATMLSAGVEDVPHSRQKRILWLTNDGRLALPPGTALVITPTLTMPFVRYPPEGFLSNMSISLPFTIDFDQLGLTDNQNPYGVLPPILARSMGRMSGMLLADYIAQLLDRRRHSREAKSPPPPSPPASANFHGGERALLYGVAEDFLSNFGMDGKACLLRAICEAHSFHLTNFGLIGEIIKLFLTASRSPYAHMLDEYVNAEQNGQQVGECFSYYKDCPRSLFLSREENRYTEESQGHYNKVDVAESKTSQVTLEPKELPSKMM